MLISLWAVEIMQCIWDHKLTAYLSLFQSFKTGSVLSAKQMSSLFFRNLFCRGFNEKQLRY